MTESDRTGSLESLQQENQADDLASQIASLRLKGADQLDPVRFHIIEALARRALQHQGRVKRILDDRLGKALVSYEETFEQARNDAQGVIARTTNHYPDAAGNLQRLFAAGDFREMSRFVARLERKGRQCALADLTRQIAQDASENVDGHWPEDTGSRSELKTMRYFRNTWSKLSAGQQLKQSIKEGPENAGPLNSHGLVLHSLALMRDASPDYLNRFMSYVDTLLWLDQADKNDIDRHHAAFINGQRARRRRTTKPPPFGR